MRLLVISILLFSSVSEARIFRFSDENFAGYFNGSVGLSQLGKDAYGDSSGTSTTFSDEPTMNYAGEVGLSFNSKMMAVFFGLEFLSPEKMELEGTNSSNGNKLMDLESTLRATILKSTLLFPITMSQTYRSYLSVYGGYAMMKLENSYELNVNGTALYPGVAASYTEEAETNTWTAGINLGVEYNFSDTATIMLEAGYRYLPVEDWEYAKSDTGFDGAYNKGDPVVNHDGSKRSTDLGGFTIGLGFRFYVD